MTEIDQEAKLKERRERLRKFKEERERKRQLEEESKVQPASNSTSDTKSTSAASEKKKVLAFKFQAPGLAGTKRKVLAKQQLQLKKPAAINGSNSYFKNDESTDEQEPRKKPYFSANDITPEERDNAMDIDTDTANNNNNIKHEEEDELEKYMENVSQQVELIKKQDLERKNQMILSQQQNQDSKKQQDLFELQEGDVNGVIAKEEDEQAALLALLARKRNEISFVDHDKIQYEPFRKDFYIESPEISRMTKEEVDLMRSELDNIKIRGVNCPKPIRRWPQCGLPLQCEFVIKQLGFENPTPIQAQAIPATMSGRDVIGIAKTGSGKTMAFLLPMFRHIKDQRPLQAMDGPIALIISPTRELTVQIYSECKRFTDVMGFRVACAYGGAPIKDQIADMKRGSEILVCTPGRLIDLLCANNGRVLNLRRITYFVLDESDRLFDFGFEQQIMRIIANIRPDAQRLLFSATFPKPVEALARKVLNKPLEITVGARSVVCSEVDQFVEVVDEDQKFVRLLEILGEWSKDEEADQRLLIFVDRQEAADELLKLLYRRGYRCLSLHGGKDQMDRDSTLSDFKSGVCPILVATSVAARGLDVPELNIVINYDCPNHKEDYVHRVGRTGRAGRQGKAYTFVSKEQERFAPGIYHALKESNADIPEDLKNMAEEFLEKVKRGEAVMPSSGFGGKGLERIEKEREAMRMVQKKSYAADAEDVSDDDSEPEQIDEENNTAAATVDRQKQQSQSSVSSTVAPSYQPQQLQQQQPLSKQKSNVALTKAQEIAARINKAADLSSSRPSEKILNELEQKLRMAAGGGTRKEVVSTFTAEIEINDFPQNARRRVSSVEFKNQITEMTQCSLTSRGEYVPPGKLVKGEKRKLYLVIEGKLLANVEKAKAEVKRVLNESTKEAIEAGGLSGSKGRYTVI